MTFQVITPKMDEEWNILCNFMINAYLIIVFNPP